MSEEFGVSVVVPSYNRSEFLSETLGAILSQECDNLEIIVVDDGSTDDTESILESFRQSHPRITVLRLDENVGESAAVNIGWASSTKRFISVVNSDDPPHKNWLKEMLIAINSNPGYAFYYPNRMVIDSSSHVKRREYLKEWNKRELFEKLSPIASAGLIIDRSKLPKHFEPRDTKVDFPSDLIQMFRLGLLVDGYKASNAWGIWREHEKSISGDLQGKDLANKFKANVGGWLSKNHIYLQEFSSPRIREAYLFGHVFLLLIREHGFAKSLLIFGKKHFFQRALRDPLLVATCFVIVSRYLLSKLQRASNKFLKSEVLN